MPADGRGGRRRVAGPGLAAAPLVSPSLAALLRAGIAPLLIVSARRDVPAAAAAAAAGRRRRWLHRRRSSPPPEVVPDVVEAAVRRAARAADQGGNGRHADVGNRRISRCLAGWL